MRRDLPPFAALRAFETAARHESFRAAAKEACQTPSAVSHQIRTLETFLQAKLFNRDRGKSSLTPAGEEYLQTVQSIFQQLEDAGARLARHGDPQTLRVNLTHTLAACWLLPRLPKFQAMYPDLDIRLINSDDPVDLLSANIDISIRYGRGHWPGLKAEFLMHEELFIVCHPDLLPRLPPMERLNELADNFSLIHYSRNENEWQDWLKDAGYSLPEIKHRIDLDSRQLVLQAAADGLGIAIGRASYAAEFIRHGKLTIAYPMRKATDNGYYLAYPQGNRNAKTERFRNWILDETHQTDPLSTNLAGTAPSGK